MVVALVTCGLGVSLALIEGEGDGGLALLVLIAGLLLQAGVNLINDHADLSDGDLSPGDRTAIRRNTRIGWLVIGVAVLIGLYLVSLRGWPLLLLGVVGVLGAWGYTGGRVNYKRRGLGVILVFLLMGVMMVGGSYYVLVADYSQEVFWLSLPFSLFGSLLLLSNELRDYEADRAAGIGTLSVRIGYTSGVRLYLGLAALVYVSTVLLYWAELLPGVVLILLTGLALWQPMRLLSAAPEARARLTPLTGRLYLLFGLSFIATLWVPLP
jgi:1,4-dihydroxy-2-naphthoate octaprenyltransferase